MKHFKYEVHKIVGGDPPDSGVPTKPKPKATTHERPLMGTMRLDLALDMNHELVRLAAAIDWDAIAAEFRPMYCPNNGRPAVPTRLMAGLQLLKHTFNLSDELTVARWVENPYWQFFCGEEFFRHDLPVHPTQMTRWRQRIGEKGVEKLLQITIEAGKATRTITETSFDKVIVDTTVQPKNVQHPTDARLYRKVHAAMLRVAKDEGLVLRQSYRRMMDRAFRKHGGHSKARQFKRAKKVLKSLKTMAGRVMRDVERKMSDVAFDRNKRTMILAELILGQTRLTKGKIYSLHAPEVECIAKGKAHRPYEFGVKVSLAVTHKEGFVVGIQTCPDNPYDGHTLEGQLDQVERLTGRVPAHTFVDRGYKGHGVPEERSRVLISGTRKLGYTLKRHLRRRSAVEPEIGHMKADGLLGRNFLKGMAGDAINAILCGAGHNMRKILARLRALLYLLTGNAWEALQSLCRHLEVLRFHQEASGAI
ncbi:IS5 family transposase [Mesoterricola sediminis]|uniref:IS5 family transposase n=3 Tax=Mesoterricola sediminis TaxID=2927980 RepID=A0AA48KCL8_9BACT|nr:IS5 family transposase [Mesoterricola sediminis]